MKHSLISMFASFTLISCQTPQVAQSASPASSSAVFMSKHDGADGAFDIGLQFCRMAVGDVLRSGRLPDFDGAERLANMTGYRRGASQPARIAKYAGTGINIAFTSVEDDRVIAVLNFDRSDCTVMAFGAPDAQQGFIFTQDGLPAELNEPQSTNSPLYAEAEVTRGWCSSVDGYDVGWETIVSYGSQQTTPHALTALGRVSASARCGETQ